MSASELAGFQKRALRARAHGLRPVAHLGEAGLAPGVVDAVERGLLDHELVKVRMHQPADKKAVARELARVTGAALCGLVGHAVILYRPHPERPRLVLPDRDEGGAGEDAP